MPMLVPKEYGKPSIAGSIHSMKVSPLFEPCQIYLKCFVVCGAVRCGICRGGTFVPLGGELMCAQFADTPTFPAARSRACGERAIA